MRKCTIFLTQAASQNLCSPTRPEGGTSQDYKRLSWKRTPTLAAYESHPRRPIAGGVAWRPTTLSLTPLAFVLSGW